jgi:hypothetical protein
LINTLGIGRKCGEITLPPPGLESAKEKFQIPSSKLQTSSKGQTGSGTVAWLGSWNFVFVISLELEVWRLELGTWFLELTSSFEL